MKIWCEFCYGYGINPNDIERCEFCEGKGYKEQKQLEADSELGRYVKLAFEEPQPCFTFGKGTDVQDFDTIEDIIQWGREQKGKVE